MLKRDKQLKFLQTNKKRKIFFRLLKILRKILIFGFGFSLINYTDLVLLPNCYCLLNECIFACYFQFEMTNLSIGRFCPMICAQYCLQKKFRIQAMQLQLKKLNRKKFNSNIYINKFTSVVCTFFIILN